MVVMKYNQSSLSWIPL